MSKSFTLVLFVATFVTPLGLAGAPKDNVAPRDAPRNTPVDGRNWQRKAETEGRRAQRELFRTLEEKRRAAQKETECRLEKSAVAADRRMLGQQERNREKARQHAKQ